MQTTGSANAGTSQSSHLIKGLVFILDGLGDRPCPQLDGRTPLEDAETPVLDALALRHQSGMMDPLLPGMPVDTHTGVGILFGLNPAQAVRLRRGPIEAAGIGLEWQPGDVLWRANLASVEKTPHGYRILDRRAGRIRDEVETLCAALQEIKVAPSISASLHPATQHRTVLLFHATDDAATELSANVSDTDPGGHGVERGILKAMPDDVDEVDAADAQSAQSAQSAHSAQATAHALNHFTDRAHEILANHPVNVARIAQGLPAANGVIVRSAGRGHALKNLLAKLNLKVAAVAGEMTIIGLARLLDFHCYSSPRFTSLPDTDLGEKLRIAIQALQHHDLVFVHIKGTDTAAHDKDPLLKSAFIVRFDQELGKLNLDKVVVGVCADHSTDSVRGEHNGDPVPVLLCNPGGRRDRVEQYNETACVSGALGRITAQGFITSVLDAMGALDDCQPTDWES